MGNLLTADRHPLSLESVGVLGHEGHAAGGGAQQWAAKADEYHHGNIKAWRFHGRYKVRCDMINFLQEDKLALDSSSTYLVLLLKRTGDVPGGDAASSGQHLLTPAFQSVFTPRGLKFPFSTFSNEANYVKSLYIFYGKTASALAKAKALKHGLDLEKILEKTNAGQVLFHAGDPEEVLNRDILNPDVERAVAEAADTGMGSPGRAGGVGGVTPPSIHILNALAANGGKGGGAKKGAASAGGPPPPSASAAAPAPAPTPTSAARKPPFSLNIGKVAEMSRPTIPGLNLRVDGREAREGSRSDRSSTSACTSTSVESPASGGRGSGAATGRGGGSGGGGYSPKASPVAHVSKIPMGFSLKVPPIPAMNRGESNSNDPAPAAAPPATILRGIPKGFTVAGLKGVVSAPLSSAMEGVVAGSPADAASGDDDDDDEENEKILHDRRERKMREASSIISKVEPHLFVSGQHPAEQLGALLHAGVTDIVNTAEMVVPCKYREYFNYYAVRMRDSPGENIMNYFPHCIAAVERARKKTKGAVLIHCHQGVSRSCTLVAVYLMWRYGLSPESAVDRVREARDVARPNPGFLIRLQEFANHLERAPLIAVHRCAPFTDDAPVPPVLALQNSGSGKLIHFDAHTCHVILQWREKRIFLWVGGQAADPVRQAALHLLPEVALYSMNTSEDAPSCRRWPADVLHAPTVVTQGSPEETHLFSLLRDNGLQPVFSPARPAAAGPSPNVDQPIPANWGSALRLWLAERRDALSDSAERSRAVQRAGSANMLSALHMENLDVKDLFLACASPTGQISFERDDEYHEMGLDEEDYYGFQERVEEDAVVFLKLRGDFRVLDVYMGQDYLEPSEDAEVRAKEIVSAFQTWSRLNTTWGPHVDWSSVTTGHYVETDDDDEALRFSSRWVSS